MNLVKMAIFAQPAKNAMALERRFRPVALVSAALVDMKRRVLVVVVVVDAGALHVAGARGKLYSRPLLFRMYKRLAWRGEWFTNALVTCWLSRSKQTKNAQRKIPMLKFESSLKAKSSACN